MLIHVIHSGLLMHKGDATVTKSVTGMWGLGHGRTPGCGTQGHGT